MRQLTRRERRAVAILLRRARPFIEQRKETFICHALHAARPANGRTHYQYRILWTVTGLIRNRMSGNTTLEDWLRWEHPQLRGQLNTTNMRDYRLAWMDELINEFEGEKK